MNTLGINWNANSEPDLSSQRRRWTSLMLSQLIGSKPRQPRSPSVGSFTLNLITQSEVFECVTAQMDHLPGWRPVQSTTSGHIMASSLKSQHASSSGGAPPSVTLSAGSRTTGTQLEEVMFVHYMPPGAGFHSLKPIFD